MATNVHLRDRIFPCKGWWHPALHCLVPTGPFTHPWLVARAGNRAPPPTPASPCSAMACVLAELVQPSLSSHHLPGPRGPTLPVLTSPHWALGPTDPDIQWYIDRLHSWHGIAHWRHHFYAWNFVIPLAWSEIGIILIACMLNFIYPYYLMQRKEKSKMRKGIIHMYWKKKCESRSYVKTILLLEE